tara:strand:+ start:3304 stop:4116 length:813 start_codon:yes stop_codon:yes gene_type:complete
MKAIIIDCGANLGQGYERFKNLLNLNENVDIEVYMFEPNINCYKILCEKYSDNKQITIYNKAVWNKEEERILNVEWSPSWEESEEQQGEIGGSSNILHEKFIKPSYIEDEYMSEWPPKYKQTVSCINLSKFILENFNLTDNIHLKLDIEGAEFAVLEKLVKDDTISYLDTLAVEWHDELIKKFNKNTVKKNIDKIYAKAKELGVNITPQDSTERALNNIPGQIYRTLSWYIGTLTNNWDLIPGYDLELGFNEKEFVNSMYKYKINYKQWD